MIKKQLLAAALVTAVSGGMIVSVTNSAFAAQDQTKSTAMSIKDQSMKKADKDLVKVSGDTQTSMSDVDGARLAIFDGQPDQARTFIDAAVTRIQAAVKDAGKYALDIKAPKAGDSYVPFNANLTVLNTFEPSAKKAKHIAEANKHLRNGKSQEAIKALKLADIDVAVTASMLPVNFAKARIEQAAKLVSQSKYYEANMALKAVDDAVVVDTYAIDAVPKPKAKS
jgi:hypothetical protein